MTNYLMRIIMIIQSFQERMEESRMSVTDKEKTGKMNMILESMNIYLGG